MFDVDIDVGPNTNRDDYGVRGSIYDRDRLTIKPHPSAVYVRTNMPRDPITGLAAIDYKKAETMGYIKTDLLTNNAYGGFSNKKEVLDALHREPDWSLLQDPNFIKKLPQIGKWTSLVIDLKPESINDLADILALIRPAKQHLVEKYKENKEEVRKILFKKPKDGMYFKKSHAYAYAAMIVCILNKKNKKSLLKF